MENEKETLSHREARPGPTSGGPAAAREVAPLSGSGRPLYCPTGSSNLATMLNRQVEHAVELLCHRGCRAVWGVIRVLERGGTLPETANLEAAEVEAVVGELKAIMSVYAGKCGVPD